MTVAPEGNNSFSDFKEKETTPLLGVNDIVEIRVFREKDLSGVFQVSEEGNIRLPLLKDVMVAGLTPTEAEERIRASYNKNYLHNAQVTLLIKKFRARKVFVLGHVKKPGSYDYDEKMTIIAVIAMAGGVDRLGDISRTIVSRVKDKKQERIQVNANAIQKGNQPDVRLLPGDIVYVSESLF